MPSPAFPWLRVAHVVRPQGHRGEVIAELLTDFPDRFRDRPAVSLRPAGADEPTRAAIVEQYRLHNGRIVLKFDTCASMSEAEVLRGYDVVIPWAERTPLGEDEVYMAELAGCVLHDVATGQRVGTVLDLDRESGTTELLVVEADDGREILVPFIKAYEPRWDLGERVLEMRLPVGLLDLDKPGLDKPGLDKPGPDETDQE